MGWERELKRQERGIDQGQGSFIASAGEGIKSILFFAGSLTFIGAMVFFLVGMIFSAGDMGGKWPVAESENVQKRNPRYVNKSNKSPLTEGDMLKMAAFVHLKRTYPKAELIGDCQTIQPNPKATPSIICWVAGYNNYGMVIQTKYMFNFDSRAYQYDKYIVRSAEPYRR